VHPKVPAAEQILSLWVWPLILAALVMLTVGSFALLAPPNPTFIYAAYLLLALGPLRIHERFDLTAGAVRAGSRRRAAN
jgi:hypothetical protein